MRTTLRGADDALLCVAFAQERGVHLLEKEFDDLRTHGSLTNRELLEDLRVHRSSAVCAILARIPGVTVAEDLPIRLLWKPQR